MTKEEAKEVFLNRGFINGLFDGDKWRQSIVAISKWLEQEPCEDTISRKHLLSEIDDLMESPWFNQYKNDIGVLHFGYIERKEAVEIVRDLCVKAEPSITPKPETVTEFADRCRECGAKYGKLIKQEPCEDAVSRKAVLEYIEGSEADLGHDSENELVCQDIKELPSVNPQPKTDILEKIKDEIHATAEMHEDGDYYLLDEWIDEIFDKYRVESEGNNE